MLEEQIYDEIQCSKNLIGHNKNCEFEILKLLKILQLNYAGDPDNANLFLEHSRY